METCLDTLAKLYGWVVFLVSSQYHSYPVRCRPLNLFPTFQMNLYSKIPHGPVSEKWNSHKFSNKLVNPANRRKYQIIIVGTGLLVHLQLPHSQSKVTTCLHFVIKTALVALTALLRKGESMLPKITKTMATVYIGFL